MNDEIITAILEMAEKLEIRTDEAFVEAVVNRLASFSYEVTESDAWAIAYCIDKVNMHIRNSCNTSEVPDGLFFVAVDRVVGEFLFGKNQSGELNIESLDLDGAVTSIKEGDTSVTFASGLSDAEKFTTLISWLMSEGESDFVCYRKLKW